MAKVIKLYDITTGKTDEKIQFEGCVLQCSECGSFSFSVMLYDGDDPNNIKSLFCDKCNGKFVPMIVTMDMMEKVIRKEAAKARVKTAFLRIYAILVTLVIIIRML